MILDFFKKNNFSVFKRFVCVPEKTLLSCSMSTCSFSFFPWPGGLTSTYISSHFRSCVMLQVVQVLFHFSDLTHFSFYPNFSSLSLPNQAPLIYLTAMQSLPLVNYSQAIPLVGPQAWHIHITYHIALVCPSFPCVFLVWWSYALCLTEFSVDPSLSLEKLNTSLRARVAIKTFGIGMHSLLWLGAWSMSTEVQIKRRHNESSSAKGFIALISTRANQTSFINFRQLK